jgi:hypothetical protein
MKSRAVRRHHRDRMKARAERIYPNDPEARKLADHLCFRRYANDPRFFKGPTPQEKRHPLEEDDVSPSQLSILCPQSPVLLAGSLCCLPEVECPFRLLAQAGPPLRPRITARRAVLLVR